mgnify:CR=1 FL=1
MMNFIDWFLNLFGLQRKIQALSFDELQMLSEPRSSQWPKVRAKHLEKQPTCVVCGGKDYLQVHHIEPFHSNPTKELDENNLITLCDGKFRCHFLFGHLLSWRSYNPNVVEDTQLWHEKIKTRPSN